MVAPYPPPLDPHRSNIIFVTGRKGSGKSVHARAIFDSYPYSKVVIDPTGDARPDGAETLTPPFPKRLVPADNSRPRVIHASVDPKADDYRDDMDRAVALGLYPSDTPAMVWVDEAGLIMNAHTTPPHLMTALMSSRHHGPMSLVMAGPRPMKIDSLAISQSDRIVIYDLPNPRDVQKLAEDMGYEPAVLKREVVATARRNATERQNGGPPFWHLVFDRQEQQLYRLPPLPLPPGHTGPAS